MAEWIISSSVLIMVMIALRYFLKGKINLRLQYALWAVVLFRMLIPFSMGSSRISVLNAMPDNIPEKTVSVGAPQDEYADPINAAQTDSVIAVPDNPVPAEAGDKSEPYTAMDTAAIAPIREIDWAATARYVWFAGIAVVGICFIMSNALFASKLKRTRRSLDIPGSPLPVYVTGSIETPCLHGFFRPSIYVTPESIQNKSVLHHVLEHEITHYHHGDNFWSYLRALCLVLHWYNPLAWIAAVLSRRDAELACDETTIKRIGEFERVSYGRTLIDMTCQKRASLLIAATTMTGSRSSIKERIALIARKPKMAVYTLVAVILIVALMVGCTFTGKKKTQDTSVTIFECGGLEVAIPSEYIDKLIVYTDESDHELISVYERASAAAASADGYADMGFGWIFSIVRYDRIQFEKHLTSDGSGLFFFAKDDDWYYGLFHPTDVRYYRSGGMTFDENERSEWEELDVMSVSVRYDFLERNNLTEYSEDEIRIGYTYNSEHRFVNFYPYYAINGSKDEAYTLVLSQPAKQGEDGIWCVERMTYGQGNVNLWFPDTGMAAADYYEIVQKDHDARLRTDHADILSAAESFVNESGYSGGGMTDGSFEIVSGLQSVMTYKEGSGAPVGCRFAQMPLGTKTDAEIIADIKEYALSDLATTNDGGEDARLTFFQDCLPNSVVARAHGPNSAQGEADIHLGAMQLDDESWVIKLPTQVGSHIVIADCQWDNGSSYTIVFQVLVTDQSLLGDPTFIMSLPHFDWGGYDAAWAVTRIWTLRSYVQENELTFEQNVCILSGTMGLDGAPGEGYAEMIAILRERDPYTLVKAYDSLSPDLQAKALPLILYGYSPERPEGVTTEWMEEIRSSSQYLDKRIRCKLDF